MTRSPRATAMLAAAGIAAFAEIEACGGSTGREGLPIGSADATSETGARAPVVEAGLDANPPASDAGPPATSPGDAGSDASFDATIEYADGARLPDVGAPTTEAGAAEAGGPPPAWTTWPLCACEQVDLMKFNPGSTLVDSGAILMDDASACRTQIWTNSQACDDCIRNNGLADSTNAIGNGISLFPSCCDLSRDGGGASAGPAKGNGKSQFQLCAELFACLFDQQATLSLEAYCGAGVSTATCVNGGAAGSCKAQVEAAFETTSAQEIVNQDWNANTQGKVGSEGEEVSYLYNAALMSCAAECIPTPSSSADASPDASSDGH